MFNLLLLLIINLNDPYFGYMASQGEKGSWKAGEIEIIDNPVEMEEISSKMNRHVGIVSEDRYWIWLNDAVRFPSGKEGIYARLLWRNSLNGPAGVAVLIYDSEAKSVYLNRNYRHATRSWELELPRGGREKDETAEMAARREALEETGLVIDQVVLLGQMTPDSGLTNTVAPIYLASVQSIGAPNREDSEAIDEVIKISIVDLKEALKKGYLIQNDKKIYVRDSFTTYALYLATLNGWID